jgi:hypothetical protein
MQPAQCPLRLQNISDTGTDSLIQPTYLYIAKIKNRVSDSDCFMSTQHLPTALYLCPLKGPEATRVSGSRL